MIYQAEQPTLIILHLIYSKSDQATVTAKQIKEMIEDYQNERSEDLNLTTGLTFPAFKLFNITINLSPTSQVKVAYKKIRSVSLL